MAHIGFSEILVILCVVVVLFGYKKLPDLGRNIGRGLRNFKRSLNEPDEIDVTPPPGKTNNADKKENGPE